LAAPNPAEALSDGEHALALAGFSSRMELHARLLRTEPVTNAA
jgi:hypothetical protein